ncbi:Gfo/Idh/MocA family protein [Rikenella microfusus]|uniref:Putative oxidoreductase n=1 Tax=Rikenella microfusus TaxID=28139 RepID=A0A379MQR1_9BACT|nr:Gfo/Idh/MocA family oxidoreductase [Rikenella microfusus]SUE33089.1 putative oxidoreductase [Rikenella microfusus]HJE88126.1 Gfo/Idh/MocA family oxidoreductase [Rikenella microfusus]
MYRNAEEPVRLVMVGFGNRARTYADYLRRVSPNSAGGPAARVVAVVEPNVFRLRAALETFSLPSGAGFDTWERFLEATSPTGPARLSEIQAAIVTTPDHLHYGIAMSALRERGYHLLLEKPIAQSYRQCLDIAEAARQRGLIVGICHPLRYHPFFVRFRELARDESRVGRIVAISYAENIGLGRMTHAFVRGLWRNRTASNTLLVSKCCHDVDYLVWLTGSSAVSVRTAGGLSLFRPERAPGASAGAQRCLDCPMERECPYSAVELYLRQRKWLRHFDLPPGFGDGDIRRVLRDSIYGRCVYRVGDNDVWDHQSVQIALANGADVALEVNGVTAVEGRRIHVMGSKGELWGDEHTIRFRYYPTAGMQTGDREQEWHFPALADAPGHAGADYALVEDFLNGVRAVLSGRGGWPLCDIRHSMEAYRIAFLETDNQRITNG